MKSLNLKYSSFLFNQAAPPQSLNLPLSISWMTLTPTQCQPSFIQQALTGHLSCASHCVLHQRLLPPHAQTMTATGWISLASVSLKYSAQCLQVIFSNGKTKHILPALYHKILWCFFIAYKTQFSTINIVLASVVHQFWDCHSEQAVSFPSGKLLSIPRMRKTTHRQENKRAQSFNQGELT